MNLWYHCYEILAAPTLSVALYKAKKLDGGIALVSYRTLALSPRKKSKMGVAIRISTI